MGFIRGVLAVFVSIVLLLVFFAGNVFLTLTLSLKYDNVHDTIKPIIEETLEEELGIDLVQEINNEMSALEINCENYQEDYVFGEGDYTITLSCESLSQGADAVVDSGIDSLIEQIYYKEHTCDFWKCLDEEGNPLFLISDYARNYWKSKFYMALIASLVLIGVLFLLFKRKHNTFAIPGILLIASAIPFLKIGTIISVLGDRIIIEILSIFFSKAHSVFRISFFTGLGLLAAGFLFRLSMIGFKFSEFFHREESKTPKPEKLKK